MTINAILIKLENIYRQKCEFVDFSWNSKNTCVIYSTTALNSPIIPYSQVRWLFTKNTSCPTMLQLKWISSRYWTLYMLLCYLWNNNLLSLRYLEKLRLTYRRRIRCQEGWMKIIRTSITDVQTRSRRIIGLTLHCEGISRASQNDNPSKRLLHSLRYI